MKKLITTFAAVLFLYSTMYAGDALKVSNEVLRSFLDDFAGATKVEWTVNKEFAKACFVLDGQRTEAFYRPNGAFMGISKHIDIADLPLMAKKDFYRQYKDYLIKEAIVFEGVDELAYFISAENHKESLVLKATGKGLSIMKKERV